MSSVRKYCELILNVLVTAVVAVICLTLGLAYFLAYKPGPPTIEEYGMQFLKVMDKLSSIVIFLRYDAENTDNDTKNIIQEKIEPKYPAIVWWASLQGDKKSVTISCYNDSIQCSMYKEVDRYAVDAKAYLFYGSMIRFHDLPLPRQPDKVLWGLFHEESPKNTPELLYDEILSFFNYSSTFSQHSTFPISLHDLTVPQITSTEYFFETKVKNALLKQIAPIIYIQTICETLTDRDLYVANLMEYIQIDSYGGCLNNKKQPKFLKDDYLQKIKCPLYYYFIARYKFIIGIENGVCDDYITEKLWTGIRVGTVPIYFGAPNVIEWLPNRKSAIHISDYSSPKLLSEYIYKLMADDESYEQHLEHKIKGKITNRNWLHLMSKSNIFLGRNYNSFRKAKAEFECFMCGKVHGLGSREFVVGPQVMARDQYNCERHMSALTLAEDPDNIYTREWQSLAITTEMLHKHILENSSTQFRPRPETVLEYIMKTRLMNDL